MRRLPVYLALLLANMTSLSALAETCQDGCYQGAGVHGAQHCFPCGVLQFVARSNPFDPNAASRWRRAADAMAAAAAARGDTEGMRQAHSFEAQRMQEHEVAALRGAYTSLQIDDGIGAARLLASGRAFLPDDAIGRYGVDTRGGVWMVMLKADNPSGVQTDPVAITSDKIVEMLHMLRTLQGQY